MRRIDIDHVTSGSKLARNVYHSNGSLLLGRGTILTAKYIERLKNMHFTDLYIDDGYIDDIIIDDVISDKTRSQALNCIQEAAKDIQRNRELKASSVKRAVSEIIDDLIHNRDMMLNLSDISAYDDYTFNHSVNVTVISIMIGMCLFYSLDMLRDLGLGVLLHDLGKVQIPPEILMKPSKLTEQEYEIVKKHTWNGFELIRSNPEIKITSAHVALQHHERYDGSGYPRQLKGKRILEFARITAVADVYDALSHDRCYRRKFTTQDVYKYLKENSGSQFDSNILERFIEKIAIYPQGTKIQLNDGRSGFAIKQNSMSPDRPVVRIFWQNGSELSKPEEINLLYNPSLAIVSVVE